MHFVRVHVHRRFSPRCRPYRDDGNYDEFSVPLEDPEGRGARILLESRRRARSP